MGIEDTIRKIHEVGIIPVVRAASLDEAQVPDRYGGLGGQSQLAQPPGLPPMSQ